MSWNKEDFTLPWTLKEEKKIPFSRWSCKFKCLEKKYLVINKYYSHRLY